MKKQVIQTPEALEFAATLGHVASRKYNAYLDKLEEYGTLPYPMAEKVMGHANLFALRIISEGNERFFYCYGIGDSIFILNGYAKRTERIPARELARALAVRNRLLS